MFFIYNLYPFWGNKFSHFLSWWSLSLKLDENYWWLLYFLRIKYHAIYAFYKTRFKEEPPPRQRREKKLSGDLCISYSYPKMKKSFGFRSTLIPSAQFSLRLPFINKKLYIFDKEQSFYFLFFF